MAGNDRELVLLLQNGGGKEYVWDSADTLGLPLGACKPGDKHECVTTGVVPGHGTFEMKMWQELRPVEDLARGTLEKVLEECMGFMGLP